MKRLILLLISITVLSGCGQHSNDKQLFNDIDTTIKEDETRQYMKTGKIE